MPGKEAGKAKPLKQKVRDKEGRMHAQNHVLTYSRTDALTHSLPAANVLEQKAQAKDYTDEDKAHLQKKKEEAAALKAARDALLKGKKK